MPVYTFPPSPVLVESTGEFAIGATGILRATEGGDAVAVYDLNSSPIPSILVGPKGAHQAFKADISDGVLDFGSVLLPVVSIEAQRAALQTLIAAQAAQAAAVAAAQSAAEAVAAGGGGGTLTGVLVDGAPVTSLNIDSTPIDGVILAGSDPTTPRPARLASAKAVWYCTSQPTNMADGDVWHPTSALA